MNNYFPEKINGPLLTHEEIIRNWALFGDGWQLFYMGDPPPHGIYPIEPVSGWWVAVHTDGDWEVQYPVSTDAVRYSLLKHLVSLALRGLFEGVSFELAEALEVAARNNMAAEAGLEYPGMRVYRDFASGGVR